MAAKKIARPRARVEHLVTKEVDNEVLIYDLERNKAHCLNETAARVWKYCDGNHSTAEIAELLVTGGSNEAAERVVWHALEDLEKAELLQEPVVPPGFMANMNGRDAICAPALTSILTVPLITPLMAPTPA